MPLETVSHHSVFLMDKGGIHRIKEFENLARVRWNRVRDDISEASIVITGDYASEQAELLNSVEPGRHELAIFRGDERVWEGPVMLPQYYGTRVEIHAKDVMHYANRTVMHARYSSAFPNTETVVNRAQRILIAELARKEALSPAINVVPHIVAHKTSTDAKTSRVTEPYSMQVWEHIDDMAAKGGLDYTVVGRSIHLWDTDRALGRTRTVTEADFLGDVYVTAYGAELATRSISTDGQGGYGVAGGVDDYYGEVELLFTAYDEESDEALPTSAELQSQAVRNLRGRNPTPVLVRIPENSSLNPNGVLSVSDLVPGVQVPLLANFAVRRVSQMQKLNAVQFEETGSKETINVSFGPASNPDGEED